jgi:hypothetical protein
MRLQQKLASLRHSSRLRYRKHPAFSAAAVANLGPWSIRFNPEQNDHCQRRSWRTTCALSATNWRNIQCRRLRVIE